MNIMIVSVIEPSVPPTRTRIEKKNRRVQTQLGADIRSEDQWKEVTKSLTRLELSSQRSDQENEDTSRSASDVNDEDNSKVNKRIEKEKSAFFVDRIQQEKVNDDGKVNHQA